uniref:Steroid 17-alpha-hydroxylase/17,20 lyase n=1 Tax=Terrapene triunguis TaxID=2587831 RepID=A0A674I4R2_9SAUR
MVPLLGALLLVLALLSFWRLAKGKAEPRPKYPRSLPSLPIIGSLLHLSGNPQLHLLFHSLQKKYGSLYSLKMGSHYMVVVSHYLHAKEVLLKKGKTFAGRPHTEALGSDSANDLMDVLLRTQLNMENNNSRLAQPPELTDDHLLMTVGDIFGAGVETTSTALKWAVLYLLHYPEVQKTIQEELDQKIGFERHPQLSDRQQLPYLEATISEVLRIRPVSPLLIPHVALTDTSIGEYTIPKGAQVIINLWSLHHDEKEWDKPAEFNPEGSARLCLSVCYRRAKPGAGCSPGHWRGELRAGAHSSLEGIPGLGGAALPRVPRPQSPSSQAEDSAGLYGA